MSRVEEALKRAHALKSSQAAGVMERHTLEAPVVPSWQYQRFPSERDVADEAEPPASRPAQNTAAPSVITTRPVARQITMPPRIRPVTESVSRSFAARVISQGGATAGREHYDRLATALHQAQRQQNIRLVMFTSALPGEGKSLTAANVAMTLSLHGRRVLLVDADLHRPTVHALPIVEVAPRLSVLPAGGSSDEPLSVLISDRMRQLLHDAPDTFDWVIVDTPPIGLVSDAQILAGIVQAAVLVIRAGSTPHELISAAVTTLGRERILGVVLNGVAERDMTVGREYYGYQ
jgi:protein-tyrosine kinase